MQLDYNILWIDDDLSDYIERGAIENLKEYIFSDLGFVPNVVTITEAAGFEIDQDELKYDLIISDYNLGDDSNTGVHVVERIREHYLTEILFYTGNISTDIEATLRTALKNIDRITIHIGRDSLIEKIQELIQLSVQKLLELNATRGLITAITSELDIEMELIAHKMLDTLSKDSENQKKLEKIYKTDYKEISRNLLKRCKAQRYRYLANYKKYYSYSESFSKWDLLKEMGYAMCDMGCEMRDTGCEFVI